MPVFHGHPSEKQLHSSHNGVQIIIFVLAMVFYQHDSLIRHAILYISRIYAWLFFKTCTLV